MNQVTKTNRIIELALATNRITTKNPYVNSWFEAPEGFWDAILKRYATRLAKKDGSSRAPNKTKVAKIVILYGNIVANYAIHQAKRPCPISCAWLEQHLLRIPIKALTAEGTGIALACPYKRPANDERGRCSKVKPLPEIMDLLNAGGKIMNVREFLQSHGFDTSWLKYEEKPLSIQDLIVSEGWVSDVPTEDSSAHVCTSLPDSGSSVDFTDISEADSASLRSTLTSFRSHTYHKGLIRVDLGAAFRQLESHPPEKQAIYLSPLNFIKKNTDKEGFYQCRFTQFSFFGRYYEFGGGIQALKRDIRQALLQPELDAKHLYNYDIAKCQANGMLQIFRHLGLDTAPLEDILSRFDDVCDDLGVPKALMKTAIYAGVWDGSLEELRKNRRQSAYTDVAEAFMAHEEAFNSTAEALAALERVREYLTPLTAEIKKARILLGIPVGAVLTQLEQSYIHTIVVLCERSDIRVVSLQHDGIMTAAPIPEALMRQAAEFSGFERARLVEKPFSEIEIFNPDSVRDILDGMPR